MPVTRPRRTFRPDAVLVQAAIAGALSFAHLHDIADAAGQHGWKAWAYPVSVDLLLVAAWNRMRTLRTTDRPAGTAWTWFAIALTASLGANVATAGLLDLDRVPAWLRILVAGWPALAFLGGTLLTHGTSATEPKPVEDELPLHENPNPALVVQPTPPSPMPITERREDDLTPDEEPVVLRKRTGRPPAKTMDQLVEMMRPIVAEHGLSVAVVEQALSDAKVPISSKRRTELIALLRDEQAGPPLKNVEHTPEQAREHPLPA
ncbi:DUF2637 domain-containing protein [Streptomyces sp. TLI_171]|uniref:DUF2637 domain-containing protein n=1 Tax=Streptomyces sp. TLI_171 TaxID=1938859 RepID=UPI000C52ED34|nr:DUF2637 domain-containing protein [Streptomyces sp. TLI_171]RKE17572.1 uncharacterized protein DUF2637 [Streptomyces sp. TLI_171]